MFTRFTLAFNFYLYIFFIHSFVFGPYTLRYTKGEQHESRESELYPMMLKEQEKRKSEDRNASRFRDNLLSRSVFYAQKIDSSCRRRRSRFKKGSRPENNPGHRRTRNQPKILSVEANELLKFKFEFLLKRHRAARFWTKNLCCVRVYAVGGEMPWKERRLMGWQSVFKIALWRILERFSRNVFSWIRFFVRRISLNFWYTRSEEIKFVGFVLTAK